MPGRMFIINEQDDLIPIEETPYDSEAVLQTLLAKYPDLLAGDQISPVSPRRWLFIGQEVGLASSSGSSDRWAIDHLFIDQDGTPTIIEVKRSSDTRIRREVVGQMIDYAANAVLYWPISKIQSLFNEQCQSRGQDPANVLNEFWDAPDDPDFWQRVQTNLQAGKVRLIFVADKIPPELKRVVEFLNAQMNPAEVLAIEVRQFIGANNIRTMVPQVIGSTLSGEGRRNPDEILPQWDRESFLNNMRDQQKLDLVPVMTRILNWAAERAL